MREEREGGGEEGGGREGDISLTIWARSQEFGMAVFIQTRVLIECCPNLQYRAVNIIREYRTETRRYASENMYPNWADWLTEMNTS